MFWCKHDWVKIKETFSKGANRVKSHGYSAEELRYALSDITTILFQCSKCKKIKTVEMLGE